VLLDQFDLYGSGLCDGDLDSERVHFVSVGGLLLRHRQYVKGADAERARPSGRSSEYVVDNMSELKEPEVAVGPRLFEQLVSR
jgi:hypothetical protein